MGFGRHIGMVIAGAAVLATVALGIQMGGWWGAAGGAATAVGVVLLGVGLYGDAARGRKRCPRCWYDMSGTPGLVCSECGRDAGSEQALMRARPRRWVVWMGALMILATVGSVGTVWVRSGWHWVYMPQWMLVECMRWSSDDAWGIFQVRDFRKELSLDDATTRRVHRFALESLRRSTSATGTTSTAEMWQWHYLVRFGEPTPEVESMLQAATKAGNKNAWGSLIGQDLDVVAERDRRWCDVVERLGVDRSLTMVMRFPLLATLVHCKTCREEGTAARALQRCAGETDPDMQYFVESATRRIEALNGPRPSGQP